MASSIPGHVSVPDTSGDVVVAPRLRLAIAADLALVAEAVGAALAGLNLVVSLLVWPREPSDDPIRRQLERARPDVCLLIYEVEPMARMSVAAALMRQWDGPWIVLSGSGPDLTWGGLREAGAVAVRPSDIGLDELDEVIRSLATEPVQHVDVLEEYVREWRAAQSGYAELRQRVESLSPRERRVLELLRRGIVVRAIAAHDGLSEATVRTQVRAVLHKLDVRSQLAAVAVLRSLEEREH